MIYRHYLYIVFLLLITVLISWRYYFFDYHRQDTVNIKDFPLNINGWTAKEMDIDPVDLVMLETKNAFKRRYMDANKRIVYLYIAYSQLNPKATNPPEILYRGSDISIVDKGKKYIIISSSNLSFKVNWLLLDNNQNQQMVYYWFKVGDTYTRSYWKAEALSALNNISGRKTGNALIRISTDIVNGHREEAVNLINQFACLIIPQLFQHLP